MEEQVFLDEQMREVGKELSDADEEVMTHQGRTSNQINLGDKLENSSGEGVGFNQGAALRVIQ